MKRGGDRRTQQIANWKVSKHVRTQTYSHENLVIVRKWSSISEWVQIEPTETQPLKVLVVCKRTAVTRNHLRFVAALYVDELIKMQFISYRQPFSFLSWLQHAVQWSYVMNLPWASTIDTLHQLATTHPNWVTSLAVPPYALQDELKASDAEKGKDDDE
jgi:hypothetical protein